MSLLTPQRARDIRARLHRDIEHQEHWITTFTEQAAPGAPYYAEPIATLVEGSRYQVQMYRDAIRVIEDSTCRGCQLDHRRDIDRQHHTDAFTGDSVYPCTNIRDGV